MYYFLVYKLKTFHDMLYDMVYYLMKYHYLYYVALNTSTTFSANVPTFWSPVIRWGFRKTNILFYLQMESICSSFYTSRIKIDFQCNNTISIVESSTISNEYEETETKALNSQDTFSPENYRKNKLDLVQSLLKLCFGKSH